MGLLIGMDEAGYGPNLGPLVITATVWEVPGEPRDFDLWRALAEVASPTGDADGRLYVADSKQVYTPARGLGALERSVLAALEVCGRRPRRFQQLWQVLTGGGEFDGPTAETEPWFRGADLDLPLTEGRAVAGDGERWRACCRNRNIRLRAIRSDVVLTGRFNRLVRECDSKGVALSRTSLELLQRVWHPDSPEPTLVIADKHGGRNRYDDLLAEVLDGRMLFCRGEGRERSVYRVGQSELQFQTKAEAHLPVALASMVSKYVRELAMELFNRFWSAHVPGLKPTKGYPTDARRFREEIAEAQKRLQIADDVLWRER